jgi:hypothetical protein
MREGQVTRSRKVRAVFAALAALLVATMFQSGASGAPNGHPRMDLRWPSHSIQKGHMGSYCWTFKNGGECADTIYTWPRAMLVKSGSRIKVRIHLARRPNSFQVAAWRKVGADDYPDGQAQRLDTQMRRVQRNGKTVAWDALFTVEGTRHYYIDVFGKWPQGDASWTFHVKTT